MGVHGLLRWRFKPQSGLHRLVSIDRISAGAVLANHCPRTGIVAGGPVERESAGLSLARPLAARLSQGLSPQRSKIRPKIHPQGLATSELACSRDALAQLWDRDAHPDAVQPHEGTYDSCAEASGDQVHSQTNPEKTLSLEAQEKTPVESYRAP